MANGYDPVIARWTTPDPLAEISSYDKSNNDNGFYKAGILEQGQNWLGNMKVLKKENYAYNSYSIKSERSGADLPWIRTITDLLSEIKTEAEIEVITEKVSASSIKFRIVLVQYQMLKLRQLQIDLKTL